MKLTLTSPHGMERLAAGLATFAKPGLVVLLRGELGAGKSVFARGFIRALAPLAKELDVPSPTFTLIQAYDETRVPAVHADLYRLNAVAEVDELGLDELLRSHIVIVEWPERLGARSFGDCLTVAIGGSGNERVVELQGTGAWTAILARNAEIEEFLKGTSWHAADRRFLEGDASFRRYEVLDGSTAPRAILMDMQARPDGPPVRNGMPYSAIAHLAEDIRAVIAVNRHLGGLGYSAPETFACDIENGLAVIEDLGSRVYGRMRLAGEDMRQPMRAAVEVLAGMARQRWPGEAPIDAYRRHKVPAYDREAQLIEADLLPGWFWPYLHDIEVPGNIRQSFEEAWAKILHLTVPESPVWVLRDYHSPNLLWLPERDGLRRVGLIDTQDCLLGHPAYDLASLLQDARVDVPAEEEAEMLEYYCGLRHKHGTFDRTGFEVAYAILGAQRATKILGIFARLSKRDGKHGYLQHLPRVSRCLERNLGNPALAPVKNWYDRHLPRDLRERR